MTHEEEPPAKRPKQETAGVRRIAFLFVMATTLIVMHHQMNLELKVANVHRDNKALLSKLEEMEDELRNKNDLLEALQEQSQKIHANIRNDVKGLHNKLGPQIEKLELSQKDTDIRREMQEELSQQIKALHEQQMEQQRLQMEQREKLIAKQQEELLKAQQDFQKQKEQADIAANQQQEQQQEEEEKTAEIVLPTTEPKKGWVRLGTHTEKETITTDEAKPEVKESESELISLRFPRRAKREQRAKKEAQAKAEVLLKEQATLQENRPVFPETFFTRHVEEILSGFNNLTLHASPNKAYNPMSVCRWGYRVVVDEPYTRPSRIECSSTDHRDRDYYCELVQKIFLNESHIMPYNVTFGYALTDKMNQKYKEWGHCVSSSSPNGVFVMNNHHDAEKHLKEIRKFMTKGKSAKGYRQYGSVPWEERQSVPVFRGSGWMSLSVTGEVKKNPERYCPKSVADMGHRTKAAMFSLDHPDLLDARVKPLTKESSHPCFRFHSTNGMDRLFRLGEYATPDEKLWYQIPEDDYYSKYQTALVLGGIGSAFRLSIHLSQGQAVVLQDYGYEEWFVKYMTPWVHYIPLKQDLSDLERIMMWVKRKPRLVKKIAEEGQKFYWEHLSYPQTEEHWYEYMWRLSVLTHETGYDAFNESEWPESRKPRIFARTAEGKRFEEIIGDEASSA